MIFDPEKVYFYQKQAIIILFIAAICCGTQDTIVIVIQPYIEISLYTNSIQLTILETFLLAQYGLGYVFGTLMACSLVDKLGRVSGLMYSGIGIVASGFMYAAVQTTEMLSIAHMFHGFNIGIFNLAIFILTYETLHIKKNEAIVLMFMGKALGTFAAVLIGQFVMSTLNGSWGLCVSFASFLVLILLPIIYIYLKDSPLYLLATDNNAKMSLLLDYVNDLEYNQLWYVVPSRRIQDTNRASFKQVNSDKFDPATIGKFWINIPEIFSFAFTGPLIYLWSVHQQNVQADDIYLYQKVQYYFYILNLPFFTDLVWNLVSLGVAYVAIRQGRKMVLVVTFTYTSIMLMYYMTLAYTNQQVATITSTNYYPSGGQGSQSPQYPYAGNNNQYTGFPYYYFPYIQTGYPNYQLIWFDWTMFGLRIIEPALFIFTLENYPTHLRATSVGLMLTFQALSKMMVRLTQALIFNISQIFYYSVLVFLLVVGAMVAFSMRHDTIDEYEDLQHQDIQYEMQERTSDFQELSSLQEPLVFQKQEPVQRLYAQSQYVQSYQVEPSPPIQISGTLDAKTILRIKELNQKYLNN